MINNSKYTIFKKNVFIFLFLLTTFSLFSQMEDEVLFFKENVQYSSIGTLVMPAKDYFFASNLYYYSEDSEKANLDLYKMSHDLKKLDSVSLDMKINFNSYNIIRKNDSIIIVTIRDFLFDNEPAGEIIILNENLQTINKISYFLPNVSETQSRKISIELNGELEFHLYASISSIDNSNLWFYSARLNSNFEAIETNKFSIRPGAFEGSNVVKFNNEYYFTALDLYKSNDGLKNWEEIPVEGINNLLYHPCQIISFNNNLIIASQLRNLVHRRGLLVEFLNMDLDVEKSNYYFEQLDNNDNLTYLSSTSAVVKNPVGDRVIIAGQNGFSIGNTLNYPKVNVPSNLFFIQYDDDFKEKWVKVLEGDAFYYMDGGIRYLTDDKIIGSGFKYAIEEDKFYGFIIMLDSETGDIISNVNTHSISPERLKLFPNPVMDHLNIDLPTSEMIDYESYSIITVQGAVLKQDNMTGTTISVGDLPSGQYVLLLHGSGKVAVGKFVKM